MMHTMERTLQGPKPMLSLSVDELPELKDWEVGKKYVLQLTVVQMSKMEEMDMPMYAMFEIEKIETKGE